MRKGSERDRRKGDIVMKRKEGMMEKKEVSDKKKTGRTIWKSVMAEIMIKKKEVTGEI